MRRRAVRPLAEVPLTRVRPTSKRPNICLGRHMGAYGYGTAYQAIKMMGRPPKVLGNVLPTETLSLAVRARGGGNVLPDVTMGVIIITTDADNEWVIYSFTFSDTVSLK